MADKSIIPRERITSVIFLIREQKVILDRDLADLYGITTSQLKQAVRRNISRFPPDFMFELTAGEADPIRLYTEGRIGRGGTRYPPMAFTEQGVAMLSSVINSDQAVQVNIEVMRAFVNLRQLITSHHGLAKKIDELEKNYNGKFEVVFQTPREMMKPPEEGHKEIGFHVKEAGAIYRRKKKSRTQKKSRA
jgi:hypothetical protein